MRNYNWQFEEHKKETSTIVGFIHNAIQNFAKKPIQSIVREGIQNSSDAYDDELGDSGVKVVIKTGKIAKNEIPNLQKIESHLRSCRNDQNNNEAENIEIQRHLNFLDKNKTFYPYIEISDYNTKGMDPKSFLYFTQGDFKSNKDDPGSQGSKGVGKAAYYACSSLRTIIISSKTKDGLQFRGTARLSTHKDPFCSTRELKSQGYFGSTEFVSENDVPIKFRRSERGTSIFIIGARHTGKDFKKEVITEVLRNYWFAVTKKQLVVEVEGELIDERSIDRLMNQFFKGYRDYRTGEKQNPRPYYETYLKGEAYTQEISNIGNCKLWLLKNSEFNLGAVARFRKTKMLIYKENNIDQGFAGVFLCDDKEGNSFLKDIENEAHDEWSPNLNPGLQKEARKTLKEIVEFINESYNKYAGVDNTDSFGLESLNKIFGFTSSKIGEKRSLKPDSVDKPEVDGQVKEHDRIISSPEFSVEQRNDKFIYTLQFNSKKSIKQQKIKITIATESSRDNTEIVNVKDHLFDNDTITLDIQKGENKIEEIEFETPYLVAPEVTSIK